MVVDACFGEHVDHQHFVTTMGEDAVGQELAFLDNNVIIPPILNIHAL